MQRMFTLSIGLLAGLALTAATARAQVQTGSILVKASDEQGSVMAGVTVTLTSPMLVAGQTSGTTDTAGVIRFPSLTPGVYSVKLDMQGFQTLLRDNIIVQVGVTVPLDVALKVATLAETVTVSGESPVVDTTSANVHVLLSQQLLQATPGGRDIWSLLEYKVPGLVMSRPDVGGTNRGAAGYVHGARNAQLAELAVLERCERRRPGGHWCGRLLLRLRRIRRNSGIDGCARYLCPDLRCLPEHGDQDRRPAVGGPGYLHLGRRRDAEPQHQ